MAYLNLLKHGVLNTYFVGEEGRRKKQKRESEGKQEERKVSKGLGQPDIINEKSEFEHSQKLRQLVLGV